VDRPIRTSYEMNKKMEKKKKAYTSNKHMIIYEFTFTKSSVHKYIQLHKGRTLSTLPRKKVAAFSHFPAAVRGNHQQQYNSDGLQGGMYEL
jgi:hypothetical protein